MGLIVFSTLMDGWFGLWLSYLDKPEETQRNWQQGSWVARWFGQLTLLTASFGLPRKTVLIFSMVMNLGFLGVFKYFNFFAEGFAHLVTAMGMTPSWTTLKIILPVGISFYTFQSMSYTMDVYRREIKYEPSLLRFAAFIALFPQLVAGPIVRARDLLPQMQTDQPFHWNRWNSGLGLILWGFFKKIAIADSIAPFVDQ